MTQQTNEGWLAEIQRQHPGLWVAIRDGAVVHVSDSPYQLHLQLHQSSNPHATIVRCPNVDEPQLVGLG